MDKLKKLKFSTPSTIPLGTVLLFYKKDSNFSKLTKNANSITEFITNPLKNIWKTVINNNLKFIEKKESINDIKVLHEFSQVVMVKIEKVDNPEDHIMFVYSYSIVPILNLLR